VSWLARVAAGLLLAGAFATPALAEEPPFATALPPPDARAAARTRASAAWLATLQPPAAPPSFGQQVAALAAGEVGAPYVYGGSDPRGFDCSGLVLWAYGQLGVALEHNESASLAVGSRVERDALQPGDVLVFRDTYQPGPSHAGIYLGEGRFVHAEDEEHGVMVSQLTDEYWSGHFYAAARLAPLRAPGASVAARP